MGTELLAGRGRAKVEKGLVFRGRLVPKARKHVVGTIGGNKRTVVESEASMQGGAQGLKSRVQSNLKSFKWNLKMHENQFILNLKIVKNGSLLRGPGGHLR